MDARYAALLGVLTVMTCVSACGPLNENAWLAAREARVDNAETVSPTVTGTPATTRSAATGGGVESTIQSYVGAVESAQTPAQRRERRQAFDDEPEYAADMYTDAPRDDAFAANEAPEIEAPVVEIGADDDIAEAKIAPAPPVAAIERPVVQVMINGGRNGIELQAPRQAPASANQAAGGGPADIQSLIQQVLAQGDGQGESFRVQLDARLLQVIAGEYDSARRPMNLVTSEQQQLASGLIESLIAVRETHLGNVADGANAALAQIDDLSAQLSNASDLTIGRFELCRRVHAFGDYEPIDRESFVSGQPVAFAPYCEMRNVVSELRDDGMYHSELAMTTHVLTRDGDTIHSINDDSIPDTCLTRRRDFFVARAVYLPATLSPGEYVVKVTVKDKLGGKVAQCRTTFRVKVQ